MRYLLLLVMLLPLTEQASGRETIANETREVIIEKAMEQLSASYDSDYYRFEISARWIPNNLLHVNPTNIVRVDLQGTLLQYSNFMVTYKKSNQTNTQEIQLKIDSIQKLPVSNHRLISGKVLDASDFDWRWVPIALGREHPVRDIQNLEGKTLRKMLLAGEPIFSSFISSPFLVNAGDGVELIYEEHGIQIVLSCEARQNGAKGEDIKIYCKETRKNYLGRIERPGVVQWQKTQ